MVYNIMEIKDSIDDIPIQDPLMEEFSAADLAWTKFGNPELHVDDVALIPYARLESFINGECSNVECPTRFHIERGRKREKGSLSEYKSDEYLLYRLYWCSFGPENHGEGGTILPSRRYRLNTRNRAARPQSMRGCTCHFAIKRLYARPTVVLIIYHERRHINKSGFICHGPFDRDAIGPGAKKIPYICSEIQQQTMSLIYLGVPEENVLQTHIEGVQRYCSSDAKVNNSLASQYVQKLGMIIKRSTHELDLDDQASIRMWVERNRKSVFYHQEPTENDPFILGIQTEWQLQQMIRFGHHSLLASDSSFGISKLKYPLYTVLAFDSRHHALPVAWVITRTTTKQDASKWMEALVDKVHVLDASWKICGFIIDDPTLELDPIRNVFCCPILFSMWRIRTSLQRNVIKRCRNLVVQKEMFKSLGNIIYSIWRNNGPVLSLENFLQDFVDQTAFMQYFKAFWIPKLDMWISSMKRIPLASQESSGSIEGYHLKLKLRIYGDSQLDSLQRVDWLVHKLTTELHSSYWLDLYADESGSFPAAKQEYISSTSWYRALQILDDAVEFDTKDYLFAKVRSQRDGSQSRTVWNPGSEFSFCDCSWSMQGNVCKHIIKVSQCCYDQKRFQSSMTYQSFHQILLSLWRKPVDDSHGLDQSMARAALVLDKVKSLVELNSCADITDVVDNLSLKWVTRRRRTFIGKPSSGAGLLALPGAPKQPSHGKVAASKKKSRKRKRLSMF